MMSRNTKGTIGFFILGILFGIITLPIMIIREYYQWKHYSLPNFEWDDIFRYSTVILMGNAMHCLGTYIMHLPWYLWI